MYHTPLAAALLATLQTSIEILEGGGGGWGGRIYIPILTSADPYFKMSLTIIFTKISVPDPAFFLIPFDRMLEEKPNIIPGGSGPERSYIATSPNGML